MEITPLQRRVTFGLVVFVLVALGAYLIGPGAHSSAAPSRPTATAPAPSPSVVPSSPAAESSPTPAATGTGTGTPGIYQWLPFTPAELTAAAATTRQFGDAYGTFSYTETPAAYLAPMARLMSSELGAQITAAYSLPGVAAARTSGRQVSTGTAVIESLRAFGPASMTFVVQVTENVTARTGPSQQVYSYAITVTGSESAWQVTDVELASAGNS
jgi:hypothetical protein